MNSLKSLAFGGWSLFSPFDTSEAASQNIVIPQIETDSALRVKNKVVSFLVVNVGLHIHPLLFDVQGSRVNRYGNSHAALHKPRCFANFGQRVKRDPTKEFGIGFSIVILSKYFYFVSKYPTSSSRLLNLVGLQRTP